MGHVKSIFLVCEGSKSNLGQHLPEMIWAQIVFLLSLHHSDDFGWGFFVKEQWSAVTYIFTAPTCTTIIITLEPCALNDEFRHVSYWDLTKFLYFVNEYHWKEGIWGETRTKDRGEDRVTLGVTLITMDGFREPAETRGQQVTTLVLEWPYNSHSLFHLHIEP
jgi:hypothetical protein